jgi:hypothetical protein
VPGPFDNIFEAYLATKVAALKLTYDFVKEKKPSFDGSYSLNSLVSLVSCKEIRKNCIPPISFQALSD